MVIVRLTNGLGNQLFQYAAARAIAHRNRTYVWLDVDHYKDDPLRAFRLGHFNIKARIVPRRVARFLTGQVVRPKIRRWSLLLHRCVPSLHHSVLEERHYHFDPAVLEASGRVYLKGYWHSEKYFRDIEGIVRDEFTVNRPADGENKRLLHEIRQVNAVSVHVRRGDYVTDAHSNQLMGLLPLEYYRTAVSLVAGRIADPHFFVFSDDSDWTESNLRLTYPTTYVSHNDGSTDYEDLRLMSACRHHIIANSTFSWWGAWLGHNAEKVVVGANNWFNATGRNTKDQFPESWIRI